MNNETLLSLVAERAVAGVAPADIDIADIRRRYDAFFSRLGDEARIEIGIAARFFQLAEAVNFDLWLARKHADNAAKAGAAFANACEDAAAAHDQLKRFGAYLGCRDMAETLARLDKLVDFARAGGWPIAPHWWGGNQAKNSTCFVGQLRILAGKRCTKTTSQPPPRRPRAGSSGKARDAC